MRMYNIFTVNKDDLLFIFFPFVLAGAIIFGHYRLLFENNPEAHIAPASSQSLVQLIENKDLVPVTISTPIPQKIISIAQEIPTSDKQLTELMSQAESQGANTILLFVGLAIDLDGNVYMPKADASSEEMLIRWTKKTVSEAHKYGLHTYVALTIVEEPKIQNINTFMKQVSGYIDRWSSMAHEYHVSFFDPGLIVGHPTYRSLSQADQNLLGVFFERKTRETYTGRIGVQVCCGASSLLPGGYNHLLLITRSGNVEYSQEALDLLKKPGIEYIFLLDLEHQRMTSL